MYTIVSIDLSTIPTIKFHLKPWLWTPLFFAPPYFVKIEIIIVCSWSAGCINAFQLLLVNCHSNLCQEFSTQIVLLGESTWFICGYSDEECPCTCNCSVLSVSSCTCTCSWAVHPGYMYQVNVCPQNCEQLCQGCWDRKVNLCSFLS